MEKEEKLTEPKILELTNLAKKYSKHKGKMSKQSADVLVKQVSDTYKEGDTISFAIPFNPSNMVIYKTRDKEDGLDPANETSFR